MAQSNLVKTPARPSVTETLDPSSLAKSSDELTPVHLNVRITGKEVKIFEHLRARTPTITDSLRVRDAIRAAVFLLACRESGTPVKFKTDSNSEVEILEYLGVFYPENSPKTRRRSRA